MPPGPEAETHARSVSFLPCLRRSTCPRSSWRSCSAGRTARCSTAPWRRPLRARCGPSMRGRRPPTACPVCTTSRPVSSKTSSRGSRPCRASTCPARQAGTAMACRSRSRWRSSSACRGRRTSRPTASPRSTRSAGSPCWCTWTRSRSSPTRLGYWIDLAHAYRTMDPAYIESVWWSLKVIYDKGLLVRDFRISPYCPRCETPLSDHEMGQPDVYAMKTDPSVTVRFPLLSVPAGDAEAARGADLLVWTTTPVDAGVQHRGGRAILTRPTWSRARRATRSSWWWRRSCSGRCSAKAGTSWPGSGQRSGRGPLPPAVQPDGSP